MAANLNTYTTLGHSGLRISPLCLGTMTFGTEWGFGVKEDDARPIFDRYIDAGGNFVDTADGYTNGSSEKMVGKFIRDRKLRDRVVLATKYTFCAEDGNPNAGGNGRKNLYRALEGSLRRLETDYIDLYYLHAWDTITPVEEVVATMDDLVRAGKIRYYGFSDTPAWYVARAQTIAEREGKERLVTLQLEYSLVERNIDREHVPVAQQLGLGICPWGIVASGFLSGKYRGKGKEGTGTGRLANVNHPAFNKFSDRNWEILEVLRDVAGEIDRPLAQVAQNWVLTQPGITSIITGATSVAHLEDSLAATEFAIPSDLRQRLDEASALPPTHPYLFYGGMLQQRILGAPINPWAPARVTGASPTKDNAPIRFGERTATAD
jgi:aryl-alcohol dehydrogenase-like predicted oxidoreductase